MDMDGHGQGRTRTLKTTENVSIELWRGQEPGLYK